MQHTSEQDSDSQDAWDSARRCVSALGRPPDMLQLCARAIMKHLSVEREHTKELNYPSQYLLKRLLRSRTFRARVYFAVQALKPERLAGYPTLGWDEFFRLFSPHEYAALITLIGLHRQAKLVCPSEEWSKLSYHLYASTDLGFLLGESISKIGSVTGMLVGAMRSIAFCAFGKRDPSALKNYRKQLKLKALPYDGTFEQTNWGCNHQKVAALLMQQFGFGIDYTRNFTQAIDSTLDEHLDSGAVPFRVASRWIDGLLLFDTPPTAALGDEYDISDHKLEVLITKLDDIKKIHTQQHWLTRTGADISAETCPALFNADSVMSAKRSVQKASKEVKQLKEHFSSEEIADLEKSEAEIE